MNSKELIKSKIQETFIVKGENKQEVEKTIPLQLYFYLMKDSGLTKNHITRTLRNILTEDKRQEISLALCSLYLEYIQKNFNFSDRDDTYFKQQLNANVDIKNIVNKLLQNPRYIQRICQVAVSSSIQELQKKTQKVNPQYLQEIAKKTPVGINGPIASATNYAQKSRKRLEQYMGPDYSEKIFNYSQNEHNDTNGKNPIEKEIGDGPNSKRKNAIYRIGENQDKPMSGILNIGLGRDGQYKPAQEDSILLYEHPENKEFKIALVADGVGGGGNGDKASYLATKITMEWFKTLPKEFFSNDYLKYKNSNRANKANKLSRCYN